MHLHSGRIMSNPEHQSTSEPRSSLEQTIENLEKSVHALLERVERVEASQRETINHEGENMLRQNNHGYFNRAPNFEHDHYNYNGPRDYDDRMSKEKIEAPTFDGCLDPWVFTNWLRQMGKFFDYYLARNCELASKSIFWRRSELRSVPTNLQPFGSKSRLALPSKVNPNRKRGQGKRCGQ